MGWWFHQGCCKILVGLLKYYFNTKISKLGGKKERKGYLKPFKALNH
jgi:hypothetical protein